MPFSFSRLFLGKKATIIDEDSLPCQPREIVPVAVDANPVTSKTKFGLTKIGRALKHKFHLNTTHTVPAGHGPLVVVADEPSSPFTPFSRCPQSPATPFQSLPHIPDVSSTLRRDFRNATRFALLAAAEEANLLTSSNDIYISTPCRKRRTQSSSVLGGDDLPRPGTPLVFETTRSQYSGYEHDAVNSSLRSHLMTPVDSPLIWQNDDVSMYSSEYNEVPDVLPLGIEAARLPFSQPFIGMAAIATAFPSPPRNWYTQQYLQSNANWSNPVMSASYPAPSVYDSLTQLPKLNFVPRDTMPGSSVYSSSVLTDDEDTRSSDKDFFSLQKSQLNTYSPIKPAEKAKIFPHTQVQSPPAKQSAWEAQFHSKIRSPPANNSAWEAQAYSKVEPSVVKTTEHSSILRMESDCAFLSQPNVRSTGLQTHHMPFTSDLENLLEPRPHQSLFRGIDESLSYISDANTGEVDSLGEQTLNIATLAQIRSIGTFLIHRPQKSKRHFRHESLVLRQIVEHAPEAVLQPGSECRVNIVANGPSRFIADFDLFMSDEQHGHLESASTPIPCSSSAADNSEEMSIIHPGQIFPSRSSSTVLKTFEYLFTPVSYETTVAGFPCMADVMKRPDTSTTPPRRRQVAFAKARRIITVGGTTREEDETTCELTKSTREKQEPKSAGFLSQFEDLKEDWHHDDQDYLHIGEHVGDYKISQQDIERDNAIKYALICLQNRLVKVNTKLKKTKALEQALELRHQSHIDAVERVTKLDNEVSVLKPKEQAGKIVFDRMMSEKLVEIASKDKELQTLREVCENEPVTKELAELHEALRGSRNGKVEYLRLAEESFKLLKRADDRQEQAEQESQTARIALTFAELNTQSAKELHGDLNTRIFELEAERNQAVEARDLALVELGRWQQERGARDLGLAKPEASTTPLGTPTCYNNFQESLRAQAEDEDAWETAGKGEKGAR